MKESEKGTHLSHCYQGENEYNCKYMDNDSCHANPKNQEGYGKYKIDKLRKEQNECIRRTSREINEIIKNCKHKIVKTGIVDTAICKECGKHFGWWCPKSKNHLCEYPENDEWCIHCGEPEERK